MAQIDFEKHIKEKLENRTITPSENAWQALADRLDAHEKKTNNKVYWWLGIAAGFIGVLFVIIQLITPKEVSPVIVDNPDTIELKEDIQDINNGEDTLKVKDSEPDKIHSSPVLKKQNSIVPDSEEQIEIALEEPMNGEALKNANHQLKKELSFEDQKVEEVVAKVNDIITQNKEVTDEEIEALLIEAQRSIHAQRIIDKSTGIVNADALLQEVETELNQSFRSKVFEAIKSSFGTLKTAVAQRNQ